MTITVGGGGQSASDIPFGFLTGNDIKYIISIRRKKITDLYEELGNDLAIFVITFSDTSSQLSLITANPALSDDEWCAAQGNEIFYDWITGIVPTTTQGFIDVLGPTVATVELKPVQWTNHLNIDNDSILSKVPNIVTKFSSLQLISFRMHYENDECRPTKEQVLQLMREIQGRCAKPCRLEVRAVNNTEQCVFQSYGLDPEILPQ